MHGARVHQELEARVHQEEDMAATGRYRDCAIRLGGSGGPGLRSSQAKDGWEINKVAEGRGPLALPFLRQGLQHFHPRPVFFGCSPIIRCLGARLLYLSPITQDYPLDLKEACSLLLPFDGCRFFRFFSMGGSCSPEFVDYLLRQQLLDRLFGWKVRDPLLLFWALRFHAVILMDTDLLTLARAFDSDNKCREYLEDLRWPDGVRCSRCQSNKISHIAKRNQYDCDSCRYQFSVRAGSIFHDSHLPLWKWFAAVYLMCESEKGISASQVKRTLKVTHKTAWTVNHAKEIIMAQGLTTDIQGSPA